MAERSNAMEYILTDSDQLADYTNRFFTEVDPVDAEPQVNPYANSYQPQYDQLPAVPAGASNGAPQYDPQSQWQNFGAVMTSAPEQGWRYLSQMSPDALRSKLLFMDNG